MPCQNDESRFAEKWFFYSISDIFISGSEDNLICRKFTADELNTMDHQAKRSKCLLLYQVSVGATGNTCRRAGKYGTIRAGATHALVKEFTS